MDFQDPFALNSENSRCEAQMDVGNAPPTRAELRARRERINAERAAMEAERPQYIEALKRQILGPRGPDDILEPRSKRQRIEPPTSPQPPLQPRPPAAPAPQAHPPVAALPPLVAPKNPNPALVELREKVRRVQDEIRRMTKECEDCDAQREESFRPQDADIKKLRDEIATIKAKSGMSVESARALLAEAKDADEAIRTLTASNATDAASVLSMHRELSDLQGNMRCLCRMRAVLRGERHVPRAGITINEHGMSVTVSDTATKRVLRGDTASDGQTFDFHQVMSPESTQEQVFEHVVPLISCALQGHKVCIFAYGASGSGKSFTMEGDALSTSYLPAPGQLDRRGVVPRTIEWIFSNMGARPFAEVKVSYLEIYNNALRDLLCDKPGRSPQFFHTDNEVHNLTHAPVTSGEQAWRLFVEGKQRRVVAPTGCNAKSSRSHSIFTIMLYREAGKPPFGVVRLVDMAGMEDLDKSNTEGKARTESRTIIAGLGQFSSAVRAKAASALGGIVGHAGDAGSGSGSRAAPPALRIPTTDKLSQVMSSSLGDGCKTMSIVTISPLEKDLQESLRTMEFGRIARTCSTSAPATK